MAFRRHMGTIRRGIKDGIKDLFNIRTSKADILYYMRTRQSASQNLSDDWKNIGCDIRESMNIVGRHIQSVDSLDDQKTTVHGRRKEVPREREEAPQI